MTLADTPARLRARNLPMEEWFRLEDTAFGEHWRKLNPAFTQIVVVEEGDEIVACWSAFTAVHVEGLWIHPSHQKKAAVGRRLLAQMAGVFRANGATSALTQADSPEVVQLLESIGGVRVPGDMYVFPIGGE